MMSLIMSVLFLIPLIFNGWLLTISFMLIMLMIYFYSSFSFFSNMTYFFGVDILSWGMIMLTCWISFLMFLASFSVMNFNNNRAEFSFVLIIMLLILILVFTVNNMMLFYVFFEASLIPTLFLIFGWGYQPERLLSGYYLLFYTLFGSLPLLLLIFYIYHISGTLVFWLVKINYNIYMYVALVLAFLFKLPMLFLHFWLPKAHVEAPISGSMLLAGVLLKLGGYGLIRMLIYIYPYSLSMNCIFISLGLFSCMMVGMICVLQVDIKSLIAYSSVAHMGMVISGIMSLNIYGVLGAYILMLGHGLCSSSLFCLANLIYERTHSRSLFINKGMIMLIPFFSLFMFLASVNNMSSPPTLNLLGEIYIILGCLSWDLNSMFFLSMGSFLSCVYSIYLYSMVNHGMLCRILVPFFNLTCREYFLIFMHLIPLNFMVLNVSFFVYLN
uniref:NADH dehydrogenase subunit 4 n=1 Tax=Cobbenicoris guangxiensis TaxID=3020184 RepID=UPI002410B6B9|nr:NADH dehydrogenase subunit 4 [Cobbenicoris guangxiensis]WEM32398.1 NADH dehydrogenase subunit 4 [Cobbenicoris guangxiensis]